MKTNNEKHLDREAFLVSETDSKGIIRFANDDFCNIAGYQLDELIGKHHNIVRHKDMPKKAFEELWKTIKKGETWTGYVKNAVKGNNGYYWVFATIYPFENDDGTSGYLSCRRKATRQEIEKVEQQYKIWKDAE